MNQRFRFCCRCVRMTLIKEESCYFCKGTFIVSSATDDYKARQKEYAETY